MQNYLDLMQTILDHGNRKGDRTGTGTLSLFGPQLRFDLAAGFPLLTTKKLHLRSIIYELLWFMRGRNDLAYLHKHGVKIWDEWALDDGTIGPGYGVQWRSFNEDPTCDQLQDVLDTLKGNPNCRRMIVSAWNPLQTGKMALPPCHLLFQFYVANNKLSCKMYQRSSDMFLGVPFNIASYALLTMMMAKMADLELGDFIWTSGDSHIYSNCIEQTKTQVMRDCRRLPTMTLKNRGQGLSDWEYDDFKLTGYDPHPHIKAKVSV